MFRCAMVIHMVRPSRHVVHRRRRRSGSARRRGTPWSACTSARVSPITSSAALRNRAASSHELSSWRPGSRTPRSVGTWDERGGCCSPASSCWPRVWRASRSATWRRSSMPVRTVGCPGRPLSHSTGGPRRGQVAACTSSFRQRAGRATSRGSRSAGAGSPMSESSNAAHSASRAFREPSSTRRPSRRMTQNAERCSSTPFSDGSSGWTTSATGSTPVARTGRRASIGRWPRLPLGRGPFPRPTWRRSCLDRRFSRQPG